MSLKRIFKTSVSQLLHGTEGLQPSDDGIALSPQVMRQLNRLQLNASRYLPGSAVGLRASMRRKPAAYFQEHRMYVPGDDIRFLDWKASARHEHVFVKQGEHPKEATVSLMLDCSASMGWGEPAKSGAALKLSAALGYLALAQADQLLFSGFTTQLIDKLGLINGKGQFPTFLNHLKRIKFADKADLLTAMRALRGTLSGRGGLVLIISDFFGCDNLGEALHLFPAPTWNVVLLHLLHPDELEPTRTGDFEMVDVESKATANYDITQEALEQYRLRLDAWRLGLECACAEENAFYTLVRSNWQIHNETLPHLRNVGVVKPL